MVELCECRVRGRKPSARDMWARWVAAPCLALLVCLVLWCTPLPDPYFASCDRPCHQLDWPMICRFKIRLDMVQKWDEHSSNSSRLSHVLTANGDVLGGPGPLLQVCENDIVVVDVVNRAPGQALGVHWGGQSQRESPHMDGVPQVSQCPVSPYSTFQYKFRATDAGTHLWRAVGSPLAEAVFGALIVKQAPARDPHHALFDEDRHVLTLTVDRNTVLVNGRTVSEGKPEEALTPGLRHRLRLLHAGGSQGLADAPAGPLTASLEGHSFLLLSRDGRPVTPRRVQSLTLWPGERADVVVEADRPAGPYKLVVEPAEDGGDGVMHHLAPAHAVLQYKKVDALEALDGEKGLHAVSDAKKKGALDMDVAQELEDGEKDRSTDLDKSLDELPELLRQPRPDVQLYLPFDFQPPSRIPLEQSRTGLQTALVPRMCNISLVLPASPLLSQPGDVDAGLVCRGDAQPASCLTPSTPSTHSAGSDHSCECVHVIKVPLGSSVEMVLVDQGGDGSATHVFTLHGHSFWTVAVANASTFPKISPTGSWEALAAADTDRQLLRRRLHVNDRPLRKDIVAVPHLGAAAIRFVADHAGYWLLREQSFYRRSAGLGVVLQVGEQHEMPPVPADFPKCGSFVGPEFFLI